MIPYTEKMYQIQVAYGLPKETVSITMMLYKTKKTMIWLVDGDTDIVAWV